MWRFGLIRKQVAVADRTDMVEEKMIDLATGVIDQKQFVERLLLLPGNLLQPGNKVRPWEGNANDIHSYLVRQRAGGRPVLTAGVHRAWRIQD